MSNLERSKYPARMGKTWSEEETLELLKEVRSSESFEEIAKKHERTLGGIVAKLRGLACDYYFYENRSIEQIMKFTGLEKDDILDSIERRKVADYQKKVKVEKKAIVEKPANQNTQLLIEIRDLLKELVVLNKKSMVINRV